MDSPMFRFLIPQLLSVMDAAAVGVMDDDGTPVQNLFDSIEGFCYFVNDGTQEAARWNWQF